MSDTVPAPAFMDDAEIASPREIAFTLPFALASLNVRQRTHWAELHAEQQRMGQEVMAAIGGPRYYPRPAFERARVTVLRLSAGQLDPDNLAAACKPLLDALCMRSPRHPTGQGIIIDDASDRIELVVRQGDAGRGDGATMVRVEDLGAMPPKSAKPKRGRRQVGDSKARIRKGAAIYAAALPR